MLKGLGTAMVGSITVLAMLGVALGGLLGETDLLNPNTSAAEARSTDAQTQAAAEQAQLEVEQRRAEITARQAEDALNREHQAALYEQEEERGKLELEHYEATLAEELASLQRQHELQLRQQRQAFEQEMILAETQNVMLLGIGSGAIIVAATAVAYYLYACGQAKLRQASRAEVSHRAAGLQRARHAPQPASLVSRKSITADVMREIASHQIHQGGDGRGPHVYSHSQSR